MKSLTALVLSGSLAQAAVLFPAGDVKVPRPLAHMEDVKTPAPPELTGPGLVPAPVDTPPKAARVRSGTPVPAAATPVTRRGLERVQASKSDDGAIWARGRAYKARFDEDGAAYVPFFGPAAPQNYPVAFATRAVDVGGAAVACRPAAPVREGDTIRFERGGFVELWRLDLEGVEQQFVFESLPSPGDLSIRIDVTTELAPAETGTPIGFSNELGRVDYGEAVAIDASGLRFAMTSTLVDGAIELRLDAQALARARLPLVVDPLVSTIPTLSIAADDYLPDVAHDAASGRYLIVYEETFSATDHDVWSELHEASGALVQGAYIDYTNSYWQAPRVANNRIAGNFMCVASVGMPGSLRTIQGNTMVAATGVIGSSFTIAGADGYDKLGPDIGGDPNLLAPTYYLVTWERAWNANDHDVHARLVQANGTLAGTSTILIDNSGGTYDTRIDVAKSNGNPPYATQDWTIVWQRYNTSQQRWQIFGAQIHWDGAMTNPTFPINVTSDFVANPRVSSLLDSNGATRPYMVVSEIDGYVGDLDVIGYMFAGTTFLVGSDIPNFVDSGTFHRDQVRPNVDSDGRHFTVVYSEHNPVGTENYDVLAVDLVYAGNYPHVCEFVYLGTSPDQELDAAITSTYSAGGARRRYLAAWGSYSFTTGVSDIAAALYDGCEGGFTRPFCFGDGTGAACPCANTGAAGNGCANSVEAAGGNLAAAGNPWVSMDTLVLHASGLPSGSTCLYFQGSLPLGNPFGTPFGDGLRCITSNIRRIGTKSNPSGASSYPGPGDALVSVKGQIPAAGLLTWYQVWYRNSAVFCSSATFNLTNGLLTVWAP